MLRPTACCVCHGSDSRSIEVAAWFAGAIIARPRRKLWRSRRSRLQQLHSLYALRNTDRYRSSTPSVPWYQIPSKAV